MLCVGGHTDLYLALLRASFMMVCCDQVRVGLGGPVDECD